MPGVCKPQRSHNLMMGVPFFHMGKGGFVLVHKAVLERVTVAAWTAVFHRLDILLRMDACIVPVIVEWMACDDAKSTLWIVVANCLSSGWLRLLPPLRRTVDGLSWSPFLPTVRRGAVTYEAHGC